MKSKLIYWIPKILIAVIWTSGAINDLLKTQASVEVFHRLGYPDYFAPMLAAAQLLGVAAILAPVPAVLREWAYAGLTFDVIAAMVSLLATGAPLSGLIFPVIALALVQTSYWTWQSRMRAGAAYSGRSESRAVRAV
jgi:hypothetical protein